MKEEPYQEAIIVSENRTTLRGIEDTPNVECRINEPRSIRVPGLYETAETSVRYIRVPQVHPVARSLGVLVIEILSS